MGNDAIVIKQPVVEVIEVFRDNFVSNESPAVVVEVHGVESVIVESETRVEVIER